MKKYLISVLCLICFSLSSFAQNEKSDTVTYIPKTPINGFWGLKFGMTKQQVAAAVTGKVSQMAITKQLNKDLMFFDKVVLAGTAFDYVGIKFYKNELFVGFFRNEYQYSDREKLKADFQLLRSLLDDKYGDEVLSKEEYSEGTALWIDSKSNTKIVLTYDMTSSADKYNVTVSYTDDNIMSKEDEKKKEDL